MSADRFQLHDVARIRAHRLAGLVGVVTDTRSNEAGLQTGVRVKVDGVANDRDIASHVWLRRGQVERLA